MAITRTPIFDDSGSGTDGTVIDNAWKQEFYNQIDAATGSRQYVVSSSTGTIHDWAPGITASAIVQWNGTADLIITGIAPLPIGSVVTIVRPVGIPGILYCHHQHAGSASTSRLYNTLISAPIPVAAGGWITYVYSTGGWLQIDHDQGSAIIPTFSAGYFSANGAGTWTVDAGDALGHTYVLAGHFVTLNLYLNTTVIGGTPSTALIISNGAFGGFSTMRNTLMPAAAAGEAGASYTGGYFVVMGGTVPVTQLWVLKPLLTTWTVGSLNIGLTVTFEVS